MSKDLTRIFDDNKNIDPTQFSSLKWGRNKRTEEEFAKATLYDGRTFIKKISRTGIVSDTTIEIPSYSSKEERNEVIRDLARDYVQSDIADMLDISQSTVSKTLKCVKKKL